jgi:hypothetical protein
MRRREADSAADSLAGGGGGGGVGTALSSDLRQYVAMAEAGPLADELKRMASAADTELWYDKSRLVGLLPKKGQAVLSYTHPG